MENNNNNNNNLNGKAALSFVSFFSSIISIFVMYYFFALIAVVTGIITMDNERTRGMSITSLIIVAITFVIKIISVASASGKLPEWLSSGLL